MDEPRLTLASEIVDGTDVIRVTGDLDVAAEEAFTEFFSSHPTTTPVVSLDLSAVPFMDSRGLNIVLRAIDALRAGGAHTLVVDIAPQALKVLEMTGLRGHLMGPEADGS